MIGAERTGEQGKFFLLISIC